MGRNGEHRPPRPSIELLTEPASEGEAAAISAQVLTGGPGSVGVIGCGVNGSWTARCLAAAGYGPGVCADRRSGLAARLASELGWEVGDRSDAAAQQVVATITPGTARVIFASDLRPGQHLAVLGADAKGKAEVELAAIERCRLFCDEWEQASSGGELAAGVAAGIVSRDQVTQLGDVLAGGAPGRRSASEVTLFDSTGLAIQDLAIAISVYEAWQRNEVQAQSIAL